MKITHLSFTFLLIGILSFFPVHAFSQETAPLPDGWKNIRLGMPFDEVKTQLTRDMSFGYRGERDVSLLPGSRVLIETPGYSFFSRCWFQFYQEKLYTIIFTLDQSMIDYFSMFNTFTEKYGPPSVFSPQQAQWTDNNTVLTLEKPLTVKYVDKKVFDELQNKSVIKKSADETVRSDFLNSF